MEKYGKGKFSNQQWSFSIGHIPGTVLGVLAMGTWSLFPRNL